MEELEKAYVQALIQEFKPKGDVLEIGFTEDSALEIEKFQPSSHTVIERDSRKVEAARAISALTVIEDSWKNASKSLGQFDSILINGYPAAFAPKQKLSITELHKAKSLLEEEIKLAKMVEEAVPNLATIKYSNEDLEAFFTEVGPGKEEEILRFLESLKRSGQISEEQYENCLQKHGLFDEKAPIVSFWKHPNLFLEFLSLFLEKHLRAGGRLCCFIDPNGSKYDDPSFFSEIITNPSLNYEEKKISLDSSEATAMLIEKSH